MIGMYDEPVAVPIIDLLDSSMMTQYITAAKEQYNQAVQDQKEFAKEFGELYSPSASLNKAYYDQTKGRVNEGLNYLYQNGIDPLRSAEGRAYISKIIRETPYAQIANWKSDAENMKTYNKSAASLMAEGKYDKDYADYMLKQQGLEPMDQFNPYGDKRWTALSPAEYEQLDALTKTYGDAIKPTLLTKDDVTALGQQYDPNNDYMGISYNQINNAADKAATALATSPQGRFEMQRIKSKMIEQGLNPTDADVQKAFAGKIAAGFGAKAGVQAMDANKFKYAKYQNDLADALDAKKSARDLNNQLTILAKQQEYAKANGSNGGAGGSKDEPTIFDVANARPTTSAGLNSQSDLAKNNVSLDKNVQITKYPTSGKDEGYTQVSFNTRDVKPMILKRDTNTPLTWKPNVNDDIEGRLIGNLTKFQNGKYYVKFKLDRVNGNDVTDDARVKEFWLEARETVKEN